MPDAKIISGKAAPIPRADIDTDMILPAQFLLRLDRKLGPFVFHALRNKGNSNEVFVLDRPQFENAPILVAGARFGIGSSREQAVWAMLDAGIRCVIAPSFGDIFFDNARRNGLLALVVEPTTQALIMDEALAARPIEVDIENSEIRFKNGTRISFDIAETYRQSLLEGLDETDQILHNFAEDIERFEARQKAQRGWIDLPLDALTATSPKNGNLGITQ